MYSRNDVINDFGDEWGFFKQSNKKELKKVFDQYFHIFPWLRFYNKGVGGYVTHSCQNQKTKVK